MTDAINPNWKRELFKRTIEMWGQRSQFEMAQEEATELALAIRKYIRKSEDNYYFNDVVSELASEIADVEIMIEQMVVMIPGLNLMINEKKLEKLNRLEKRIQEGRFEDEK